MAKPNRLTESANCQLQLNTFDQTKSFEYYQHMTYCVYFQYLQFIEFRIIMHEYVSI